MKITEILRENDIIAELAAATKDEVLQELAGELARRHPDLDPVELVKVLQERERLGSTGIGDGIAIPHGKLKGIGRLLMLFGRSRNGIDYDSLDGRPAYLFFLLLAPDEAVGSHLKLLARMSRLLKDGAVRKGLMTAQDAAAVYAIISRQDGRS